MPSNHLNKDEKQKELRKYCELVLATIDYYLDNKQIHIRTEEFDSADHYRSLKTQVEEHFQKGRLTQLKQWFRDLTEMQVETADLKFNKYLQDRTKYEIDIFKAFFQRVDKIVASGKITSDNQFYDINIMVDQLCQIEPVDKDRIAILDKLLFEYKQRKSGFSA